MPNWKLIDKTYLYDGTFDGLLSMVFDCYIVKSIPCKIVDKNIYVPNLLDDILLIETDCNKSKRIYNGIVKNISYDALYNSYYAFLSSYTNKELYILKYFLDGFVIGPKINTMLHLEHVFKIHSFRKNVLGECHRLKGLVRFIEIEDNLFYSSIHPDHNVIENLGQHFTRRLCSQNFILHDKNRNIAFVYNQKEYIITEVNGFTLPSLSEKEKLFQNLWKTFFYTISIKERTNPRLQANYMPKRYWKDLIEI